MSEFKKFPGQPILSQILNVIPSTVIHTAGRKHNANRYYKRLPLRLHLISLLYGVFSYCNGLREVCEGLLACEGKLRHLGLDKAPARSTLSDANNKRSYQVFETIYYGLLRQYHSFISDSRLKGLSIRNLKVVDSSTIQLFIEILRGVGRARGDGSRKKGGFKVHAMMDAFSGVTEFVRLTEAREHDQKFLHHLKLPANSWLVFDKAYTTYYRFAKWSEQQIWFVNLILHTQSPKMAQIECLQMLFSEDDEYPLYIYSLTSYPEWNLSVASFHFPNAAASPGSYKPFSLLSMLQRAAILLVAGHHSAPSQ